MQMIETILVVVVVIVVLVFLGFIALSTYMQSANRRFVGINVIKTDTRGRHIAEVTVYDMKLHGLMDNTYEANLYVEDALVGTAQKYLESRERIMIKVKPYHDPYHSNNTGDYIITEFI